MSLKVFQFYLIPHPFKEGEKIIVSDDEKRGAERNAAWEFCRTTVPFRPRILRFLISAEKPAAGIDREQYFKNLKWKEDRLFSGAKLKIWMRFLSSILIGYLLYLAPPSFWAPIEALFDSVAHGLSDYAKWWIILIFPLKGFIRNFGSGIRIPLPGVLTRNPVFRRIPLIGRIRRIGADGRWQKLSSAAGSTELYETFEKIIVEEFSADVEKCRSNIERKSECAAEN